MAFTPNSSISPYISLFESNISLAFFIPTASNKNEYWLLSLLGFIARFQAYSKSLAVTGEPSDHSTSSLILKVHILRSSLISGSSAAISGTGFSSSSKRINPEKAAPIALLDVASTAAPESIVGISEEEARRRTCSSAFFSFPLASSTLLLLDSPPPHAVNKAINPTITKKEKYQFLINLPSINFIYAKGIRIN